MNIGYLGVSPNYDPIDGYTAELRHPRAAVFHQLIGSSPAIKNYSLFFERRSVLDDSGEVHQADAQVFVNAMFKNHSRSTASARRGASCARTDSRRTGLQRRDSVHVELHRLSVLPRRRDAAVQSVSDSHRLSRRHARRRSTPSTPGARSATTTFTCSRSSRAGPSAARDARTEYDGTYERAFSNGVLDSQWLRRISLGYNISSESSLSIGLRDINGYGGFATQIGNNLADRRSTSASRPATSSTSTTAVPRPARRSTASS